MLLLNSCKGRGPRSLTFNERQMQMASLSKDKSGNRTIQFVAGDRKRRSIRLGKMPQKAAETIKAKVESLNAAAISQTSWDAETAAWVGKLESLLYDKLAKVGLLPVRAAAEKSTLGAFLEAYIKGRSDVKGSTAIAYEQTRRCLVEYFGAVKALGEISSGDADDWRRWMMAGEVRADGTVVRKKLGDNTVRRRCGFARQFFRAAVRKRLIAENPFGEMKGVSIRSNRARDHFIPREDAAKVLDHCPDTQWKLLFALSRFGGLRCPSEHLALRWIDVDWTNGRMTVRSPKTEHHEGGDSRVIPIFPELRPYLEDAWELAKDDVRAMLPEDRTKAHVITRYRDANSNLRTQLERIIAKAGLKTWPKLFQNLRATRATELAAEYPAHVAAEWLGHSTMVAQKHYWRVTDADFEKAASQPAEAVQKAVQSAPVSDGQEKYGEAGDSENCENSEKTDVLVGSRVDSNHRLSACKAAALAAEPRDHRAETEGIEPPTLAGSCFQDSVLDQPDSLLRASIKQQRPESNGRLLVQSESCEPLHYAATCTAHLKAGSRRIERRLTGSEPVVRPLHQEPIRAGGIEPPPSVWKTDMLPLHHTRVEQAAEAGIEPAGDVLNRHAQLPAVAPPQRVCAAGFEPAISTSQASRDDHLHYAQSNSKASSGSRTRTSAMARQ